MCPWSSCGKYTILLERGCKNSRCGLQARASTAPVLFRCCSNTFPVLLQCCTSTTPIQFQYCFNTVPVLFQYCSSTVSVLFQYSSCTAPVLFHNFSAVPIHIHALSMRVLQNDRLQGQFPWISGWWHRLLKVYVHKKCRVPQPTFWDLTPLTWNAFAQVLAHV